MNSRAEKYNKEVNRDLWIKKDIVSLWPWPLTQGHRFLKDSSQCVKQPISQNRVQIGASKFYSQALTQTDRHTHTQTNCNGNITHPPFCEGVKSGIISNQSVTVITLT